MTETKPVEPTAGTPINVYDHSAPAPAATAENKADGDVEAQKAAPAAAASAYDDEAGKSTGIAMFICIVVGFALGWVGGGVGSWISFICLIAAIVLSSTITCGCGSNLNLDPKVKRWSTATLLCLVIQLVLAIIAIMIAYGGAAMGDTTGASYGVAFALLVVTQILYILAGVFAGVFTWGRKSCGNA
mmetsp:Transcript_128/g.253  ORF Transcript_128/g.253 Transcript_128/m.253 type:complete len:187 (+) Transcript_128:49-609(+)